MVKIPMEELVKLIELQLKNGEKANLTVTGCSMLPMLREFEDTVLLKSVEGRLQPGDIALYLRDNGSYVLHRVIRCTEDGYLFCGDNQAQLEPVREEQLIARVVGYGKKGEQRLLDTLGYRLYCGVMVKLFGIRKYYIWLRRRLGRLRKRYFKRRK